MKDAFVYYRIDPAQADVAAARVDALLSALAGHCARPPQRLQRCGDPSTWMEAYQGIADFQAFADALGAAAQACGCAAFTLGERHLECFARADHASARGD